MAKSFTKKLTRNESVAISIICIALIVALICYFIKEYHSVVLVLCSGVYISFLAYIGIPKQERFLSITLAFITFVTATVCYDELSRMSLKNKHELKTCGRIESIEKLKKLPVSARYSDKIIHFMDLYSEKYHTFIATEKDEAALKVGDKICLQYAKSEGWFIYPVIIKISDYSAIQSSSNN